MTTMPEKRVGVEKLARLEPFGALEVDLRRDLLRQADLQRYPDDTVLREAGAPVEELLFIVEGHVKVVTHRLDESDLILGIFGPGHPAGGIGLYDESYPGRVVALGAVEALEVDPETFFAVLDRADIGLEPFVELTAQRSRFLSRRLHDATVRPAERRLALVFQTFRERWGQPLDEEEGIRVPLRIQRRDLANLINTRTETAIRLVRNWERSGVIRTDSDGFVLVEPDEIDRLAAA